MLVSFAYQYHISSHHTNTGTVSLSHMLNSLRMAFHNVFDGLDRDSSDICIYDCARLVGCFCDSEAIFDIVLAWARGEKGFSSSMQRCSNLALLGSCIEGLHLRCTNVSSCPLSLIQLGHVARLLSDTSLCGTNEILLKRQVLRLVYAVVDSSSTRDVVRVALERRNTHSSPVTVSALKLQLNLMRTILQLKSRDDGKKTIDEAEIALSKAHGMSLEEIHVTHARSLLEVATKDCNVWSIDGPNAHGRRLFEQILGLSSSSLAPLANEIVSVFASVLTVDRDPKVRLALLACLEAFLNRCTDSNDVLTRALRVRSEILLERVLFPCCVWRVGLVESTLRKLAMAALLALVSRIGVESLDIVSNQFRKSQGTLVSCLEDDDVTTRRLSCRVMTKMFEYMSNISVATQRLRYEQINDLYPKLLKRLDDSDDEIRKDACLMLVKFWSAAEKSSYFHETCMVYTFDVLFLHLDDPSLEIQRAVFEALSCACELHPKLLTEKASESRGKHRTPEFCDKLIRLASSMLVEKNTTKEKRALSEMDLDDEIDTGDLDDIDE